MDTQEIPARRTQRAHIEYRLFENTLRLTIVFFVIWIFIGFLAGYQPVLLIIYITCLVVFLGLYVALKAKAPFNIVVLLYYSIAIVMLAYSWFPTGGITGAILHLVILVYITGMLVLPSQYYLYFIIFGSTMVIALAGYEYFHPDLAAHYQELNNQVRDLSVSGLISLGIIGACLYMYKREYTSDRKKLHQSIAELAVEKEKAQSADKAKSNFLATISHEMRTPLNGIVGISELLKETNLNKEQQQLISSLSYSSELLHGLITDLLDIMLIESGKMILQKNKINIREEIKHILDLVRPRLAGKEENIELRVNYDPSIPEIVIGDALRFRQILLNLVNNAIKFTEQGSILVLAKPMNQTEDQVTIFCSVKDTGIGISEVGQKKLFSKFFKENIGSNIEGTGLGLSICKKLVGMMGGTISFRSEEGVGSEFFFEITFNRWQASNKPEIAEKVKMKLLKEISVLVAEDVPINQIVVKRMLENIGFLNITVVDNGEQALEMVKQHWFDLVLMDIQMPVMDGIEASKAITTFFRGKKKPVIIALTANVFGSDKEEYKKAGISGFLSKPITKNALWEVLSTYI